MPTYVGRYYHCKKGEWDNPLVIKHLIQAETYQNALNKMDKMHVQKAAGMPEGNVFLRYLVTKPEEELQPVEGPELEPVPEPEPEPGATAQEEVVYPWQTEEPPKPDFEEEPKL